MQTQRWLLGVALIVLLWSTACANPVRADSPTELVNETKPGSDLGSSLQIAIHSTWDLVGAVGNMVTQIGTVSPQCLGTLTCLILLLAGVGAWTLGNWQRILGMITLRDGVRSFLRD